jgi:RNA polymerase sigma-70 factor (ECF subfamily)
MGQATDGDLWRRGVDGDPDAFSVLFERHAQTVYNYVFRRTADWALAEDLTSVVFLEAWRRRNDVRLDRELVLPWLLGVATNVLRNRRRSQWRHRAALMRLPRELTHDFADEANGRLDDERQMRTVLRAIARLPRREQDVLVLCACAELTYEEVAVALGVPVGTVRSRLSRARARIRKLGSDHAHTNRTANLTSRRTRCEG